VDWEAKLRIMTPPSRQIAATSSEDDVEEASNSNTVGWALSPGSTLMEGFPVGIVEPIAVTVVVDILQMLQDVRLRKQSAPHEDCQYPSMLAVAFEGKGTVESAALDT